MKLFLFGSLRDPELFRTVAGEGGVSEPYHLAGYRVDRIAGHEVPMLVRDDGASAVGVLWTDLTPEQIDRLDRYERPWGYFPRIVCDGITVYWPKDDIVSSGELWSFERWQATDAIVSRAAAAEIYAHNPPLSADQIVLRWPQIRARACSRARASQSTVPATLRRSPGFAVEKQLTALDGDFFKYRRVTLAHERFDGKSSADLPREAIVAFDAALVLPYDPERDRFLFVEQFRVGPFLRGDANPWAIEPVAGIIDAEETPENAARREAEEEANLTVTDLRPMFAAYPSPGNSTEQYYAYAAICDLPDTLIGFGGLDSEAEDIRVHLVDREQALELIDTGEINILPLITMIYWVDRNRGNLGSPA